MSKLILAFQQDLAGHVFYTGRQQGRQYRWGIQSTEPFNDPDDPYVFECVALTAALPGAFLLRPDGQIYADDDFYARDVQVLVESQAVGFEWATTVACHRPTYQLHLPVRPRADPFWTAVVKVARELRLERLEAASDEIRQCFVRDGAWLETEPYFGARAFADDIPAAFGWFFSTSVQDVQVFYDALAGPAGWPPLSWTPMPDDYVEFRVVGCSPRERYSFMPR